MRMIVPSVGYGNFRTCVKSASALSTAHDEILSVTLSRDESRLIRALRVIALEEVRGSTINKGT